jgi:hypothetical protein
MLKQILKNINLFNLILFTVSLLFAFDLLLPRLNSKVSVEVPSIKKNPSEKGPQAEPKIEQNPSPMEYVVIADENLFHPERRIPPEKKEEAELPKPEFILFGTLITPNMQVAYLEDKKAPVSTPGRGKRQTALKKGGLLSGFTLKEILPDRVVMTRGDQTILVPMEDPNSPKTREAAATAALQPHPPGTPVITPGIQPTQRALPSRRGVRFPAGSSVPPTSLPARVGPLPGLPVPNHPGATLSTSPYYPSRRLRNLPSANP